MIYNRLLHRVIYAALWLERTYDECKVDMITQDSYFGYIVHFKTLRIEVRDNETIVPASNLFGSLLASRIEVFVQQFIYFYEHFVQFQDCKIVIGGLDTTVDIPSVEIPGTVIDWDSKFGQDDIMSTCSCVCCGEAISGSVKNGYAICKSCAQSFGLLWKKSDRGD